MSDAPAGQTPTVDDAAAALAAEAVHTLNERTGVHRHDIAIVLGSGWGPALDALGEPVAEVSFADLPGFTVPAVVGHAGRVRSYDVDGRRVLAVMGRTHLYEGRGPQAVVHAVRTAAAAGCSSIVLTNAAGGLRPGMAVGDAVVISDHLNLTFATALLGPQFIDLTDTYSPRLRALVHQIDPTLTEGVYAMFHGPQFETPAEVRMAGLLGADLVGMSTVLEAVAARAAGVEVLGLSLVTNLAAGLSGGKLDHLEVLEAGRAAAARMGSLLAELVRREGG